MRQAGKRADRMASFRIAHAPPIWPPILRRAAMGRTPHLGLVVGALHVLVPQ